MMHVYCGRAGVDKDKFIFDQVKGTKDRPVSIIVPDQYTLQAERNAFEYLQTDVLLNVEILSQSRLAHRIFEISGRPSQVIVDRYGRYMLLSKILQEENEKLHVFQNMNQKASFIQMTDEFLSEMEQFKTEPQDLDDCIKTVGSDTLLGKKLADIQLIYHRYQDSLEGKFSATGEYNKFLIQQIEQSQMVGETVFWIDGFDYFTPDFFDIIEALVKRAAEVNIVLTYGESASEDNGDEELFQVPGMMLRRLREISQRLSQTMIQEFIDPAYYAIHKKAPLLYLENNLFRYSSNKYREESENASEGGLPESLELCKCSNFYSEAEAACAKITELVRDYHFRYKDIAIICNDMDSRGSIMKRVAEDYGIPLFLDKTRTIAHNPAVEYIFSLLDIVYKGRQYQDVFRFIKTGLSPISREYEAELENYCIKYRISGNKWKKIFRYGVTEEGEEMLEMLNEMRQRLDRFFTKAEEALKETQHVREKTQKLYAFLENEGRLPEVIDYTGRILAADGYLEYAEETAQIWSVLTDIFDQLIEIIGDEVLPHDSYVDLLKRGLESVEIGMLPSSNDQVVFGTLQRTKLGRLKALFVMGVNDGVLPSSASSEGLLDDDERQLLLSQSFEICSDSKMRKQVERLSIYSTLSKADEYVWMSYALLDADGGEIRPSQLVDRIHSLYPKLSVKGDLDSRNDPKELIQWRDSALKHLCDALMAAIDHRVLQPHWDAVYKWFQGSDQLKIILDGIFYERARERLDEKRVKQLFGKGGNELILSPSRLERFSKCPFSHFVQFGLRPEEQREFQVDSRAAGDIYHQCLMELSDRLTEKGIAVTDPSSLWMSMDQKACHDLVDEIITGIETEYRESILKKDLREVYRSQRIRDVCKNVAWAMVRQVQAGSIRDILFEAAFNDDPNSPFPSIEVPVAEKETVKIQGKIDRVDLLYGQGGQAGNREGSLEADRIDQVNYVNIIDYKSGFEKFSIEDIVTGWKLQLMLYLQSALNGIPLSKPAGVFYFGVEEARNDIGEKTLKEYLAEEASLMQKNYRLDGAILYDEQVIRGIAGDFSDRSEIVPLRKNKDGSIKGNTVRNLLTEEEFAILQEEANQVVQRLCHMFYYGVIDVEPKANNNITACTFCSFKSICGYGTISPKA